jgi:hypothetical protein
LLNGTVTAATLVDQLWIVDNHAYDQGVVGSVIGGAPFNEGVAVDTQVVDDFTVPAPGYIITDVVFDYLAAFGGGAEPFSLIEVFPDAGGYPSEVPVAYDLVSVTSDIWFPIFPLAMGARHHASGLAIELPPGHYWIGMQPISLIGGDWGGTGSIYLPVQDTDSQPAGHTFLREPGMDPDVNHEGSLGFGPLSYVLDVPNFITTVDEGLAAGDTSFRVDGVAVPDPTTLSLLAATTFAFASGRKRSRVGS